MVINIMKFIVGYMLIMFGTAVGLSFAASYGQSIVDESEENGTDN